MFGTQNNESMNNAIAYVPLKNHMMSYSRSLNNRISCVVVISIFRFKKYCKTVFNFMKLNMSTTLKQFLQAKTVNAEKTFRSFINVIDFWYIFLYMSRLLCILLIDIIT